MLLRWHIDMYSARGDMYGIPNQLNLDVMVGTECTQIRVGQFDIQFIFGEVSFAVQSRIVLYKYNLEVGYWEAEQWPCSAFYEILNVPVESVQCLDKKIIINLDNGFSLHMVDNFECFETMQISFDNGELWII
jgi:hypothetical protein